MHKELLHELAAELDYLKYTGNSADHQAYEQIEAALIKVLAFSRARVQVASATTPPTTEVKKAIAATDKRIIEKRAEMQQGAQQRPQRQQMMPAQRPMMQSRPMAPMQRPTMQQRPVVKAIPANVQHQTPIQQPLPQGNQQTGKRVSGYKRAYSNNIRDWI